MSKSECERPSFPAPLQDAVLDGEQSAVRARAQSPQEHPPRSRVERVENKVRLAIALQHELGPEDSRARLVRLAIVRRDEVLLDELLSQMKRATPPRPPPEEPAAESERATLLPPSACDDD